MKTLEQIVESVTSSIRYLSEDIMTPKKPVMLFVVPKMNLAFEDGLSVVSEAIPLEVSVSVSTEVKDQKTKSFASLVLEISVEKQVQQVEVELDDGSRRAISLQIDPIRTASVTSSDGRVEMILDCDLEAKGNDVILVSKLELISP